MPELVSAILNIILFITALYVITLPFYMWRKKCWKARAAELGLEYENDEIKGQIRDRKVRIYTQSRSKSTALLVSVTAGFDFEEILSIKSSYHLTEAFSFRRKPFATGDRKFDQRLRIKGNDHGRLMLILDTDIRTRMIECPYLEIYDGMYYLQCSRVEETPDALQKLLDIADILEERIRLSE